MRTYKDIKNELDEAKAKIESLTLELQHRCPHRDIIFESYCNDDWAMQKIYTSSYKCNYCGKYVSYDPENNKPKSKDFILMEQKYNSNKCKK